MEDLFFPSDLALEGVKIPCNLCDQTMDFESTVVKDQENSV